MFFLPSHDTVQPMAMHHPTEVRHFHSLMHLG